MTAAAVPAGTGFGSAASVAAVQAVLTQPAVQAPSAPAAPAPVQAAPQAQTPAPAPAAAEAEPPAPDTSTPAGEVAEVWRERYRKLQAAKDREVAEANRRLQAAEAQLSQPPQPQVATPAQAQVQAQASQLNPVEAKRFLEMINSDNPQQGMDYLMQAMERRAQEIADRQADQRVQMHMENAQKRAAFVREFEVATTGFSEAEQQATVNVISEAHRIGQQISPREAAIIARFGSMENAVRFANQAIMGQQAPVAPVAPAPQPQMPLGQFPSHFVPQVPGNGMTPPAAGPQNPQAPAPILEHRYRGLL
jgi:hypothetical protein